MGFNVVEQKYREQFLTRYQTANFWTGPNSKNLQMTNETLLDYDFCL